MDHFPVEYARTPDGISIGYTVLGEGPAVVFASNIFGTLHVFRTIAGWQSKPATPAMRSAMLARGWRLVIYDGRGMGASDRAVDDFSLDARVRDLETLVDHLNLDRFALTGFDYSAATAIAYTARHPERVTHLVLRAPWATGAGKAAIPAVRVAYTSESMHWATESPKVEQEWKVFTDVMAGVLGGFGNEERNQRVAAALQVSTTPRNLAKYFAASEQIDLRSTLAQIRVPTLVIFERGFPFSTFELAQEVATGINVAQIVELDGDSGRSNSAEVIDAFLRDGAEPTAVGKLAVLTARERQVLQLIARGSTNREIADRLVLSERTVARHITNLYAKIDARSKAEATAYAFRHRIA
jgi:pimeloyl-ACP methyl ester carboxylesterase/DNA-binding CsgD family transcriptional regulator